MGNRKVKLGVAIFVLAGAVLWLGVSGYEEGKSYYKTADEFVKMSARDQSRRIRLMGNVEPGSIRHDEGALLFAISLNGATVPVVYRGKDPVPDTFKDNASALIDGSLGGDGRFEARQIQAKCASKYEADPTKAYGQGTTKAEAVPTKAYGQGTKADASGTAPSRTGISANGPVQTSGVPPSTAGAATVSSPESSATLPATTSPTGTR